MAFIAPARFGSSTWLLQLRTFAVVGQLVTILIAQSITTTSLPIIALLLLVGLTALTNFLYGGWLYRISQRRGTDADRLHRVAFVLMAFDLVILTAMLHLTGGVDNPFSFFYFVNLAVGGVMLHVQAVWALSAFAVLGYGGLLIDAREVAGLTVQPSEKSLISTGMFELRELGLWFAFAACAAVVTYFVTRTAGQLRRREEDLRRTQSENDATRRLEGLTTLAAGAAHELATPLTAIDIACRELSRHLDGIEKPKSIDDDLKLIDGQLMMCRQILSRMRSAVGDAAADQWNQTTLGDLIDTTLEGIRDPHRVDIANDANDSGDAAPWESQGLYLPAEAVAQSIRNLIHNALDASEPHENVSVHASVAEDCVTLRIIDSGEGMSDDVLDRAGDPFFTTKEPGRGIGLGLFLTRNVITRLGGSLRFESQPHQGTTAIVTLPRTP